MWEFLAELIGAVAQIWWTDSEMRNRDPLTSGSEFDRQSRRFVARLCGGIILLMLIAGFLVWWFTKTK